MEIPLERQAMNGEPVPSGLSQPDQLLYLQLRILYAQYRSGQITREQGTADKGRLLYEWKRNKTRVESSISLSKWHADLRRRIETAHNEYRKNPTAENAEKLSLILDGILRE